MEKKYGMTVQEAAQLMGKSQDFVRIGLPGLSKSYIASAMIMFAEGKVEIR